MATVLFIGNFLSKVRGTIGPSEYMCKRYKAERPGLVHCASHYNNQLVRLLHMLYCALFVRYDIVSIDVYSYKALMFSKLTSKVARWRGKKIVLTLRGGALIDEYEVKETTIKALFGRADVITSPSMMLCKYFGRQGFDVRHIPNTIDLQRFSYKKEREPRQRILWVRAFTPIYNPDVAVRAFAKVLEAYPGATLTMVGPDKGQQAEVEKLIADLGLGDKVVLTGKIANDKLPEYYQQYDVYLNTTSYESFGVALLEAAACGLPIVSTAVGEIPLIWEAEEDILLTEEVDADMLAKQVGRLFDDKALYAKLQENAYKKSQGYSWQEIRRQWDKIFELD